MSGEDTDARTRERIKEITEALNVREQRERGHNFFMSSMLKRIIYLAVVHGGADNEHIAEFVWNIKHGRRTAHD